MYSSPRAPNFETDISVDDEGHAPDEDSVSSVHSDESTSAPLSPPGMIICVRSVQRNMYHCILNFRNSTDPDQQMHSDHRHQADLEHSDFSLPREGGGCAL